MIHSRFLIFTLLLLNFCSNSEKIELKLNLIKGKTYKLAQNTEQNIKQTIDSLDQNIHTSMTGIIVFLIKDKQNGNYLADVKFEKMKFEMNAPMINMSFDSEQPVQPGDVISEMFSNFIDKIFTISFKNTGQIISVLGIEKIAINIIENLKIPSDEVKKQLFENFKKMMGEKVFKGNFETFTYIFPEKNILLNESWQNEVHLESTVPVTIKNTWKLSRYDSKLANIIGTSIIKSNDKESWVQTNNLPTKYKTDGSQTADIKINPKNGWISVAIIKSKLKGKIIVDKNTEIPNGLEIPIEIETTNKYKAL